MMSSKACSVNPIAPLANPTKQKMHQSHVKTAKPWLGTPEFAEFWNLPNATCHCSGRRSEVSLVKAEGITIEEICDLICRCDILAVQLQRKKSGPCDKLPIYPHRDGILKDFCFSLVHLLVVNGCSHEHTLPIFYKAALNTKKSGESDSRMSSQWTNLFKHVRNTFKILVDEINEELGSHSNRRGPNQVMVESPSLGGYAPTFRSGLRAKVHNIVHHTCGSTAPLRKAGQALSRWTMKIGETTIGRQPLAFDDIESDVNLSKKFTNAVFEDDTAKRWKPKVRESSVTTLLL